MEVSAVFRSYGHESFGKVEIEEFSFQDRVSRTLTAAGITAAAAIGTLFIPIVHFVLPFVIFLIIPIVSWLVFRTRAVVTSGQGSCPVCQQVLTLDRRRLTQPFFETCPQCGREVEVEYHPEKRS
jgi:hypothetical protein